MAQASKQTSGLVENIKTVIYALVIAGIFRTLFFQPFWIPSGSMKDTLLIGDFLFVNKMAYGYSYASCPSLIIPSVGLNIDAKDICGKLRKNNNRLWSGKPERGDVVVFRHPVSGRDYIKRLVGLPGDRVQIKNSVLFLNDVAVESVDNGVFEETYAPQGPMRSMPRCANGPVGNGSICEKPRQTATLPNGVLHSTLDIGMQAMDNTPVFTVPAAHYFFMGDNRDNSTDSRRRQQEGGVGFVPFENLIGRADRIMFSSAGKSMLFFWTWRSDRFFKSVK